MFPRRKRFIGFAIGFEFWPPSELVRCGRFDLGKGIRKVCRGVCDGPIELAGLTVESFGFIFDTLADSGQFTHDPLQFASPDRLQAVCGSQAAVILAATRAATDILDRVPASFAAGGRGEHDGECHNVTAFPVALAMAASAVSIAATPVSYACWAPSNRPSFASCSR